MCNFGKLAAFLRLAGFDALLMEQDAEVADVAARDRRIALTRDVGLLKRSVVRHGYWVRNIEPEWQLAEVLTQFDLVGSMEPFARCTRCNARVVPCERRLDWRSAPAANACGISGVSPLPGVRPRVLARLTL